MSVTVPYFPFSSAPSSPPQSVDITKVGSRGVVVSWTPPAIVHQNGPITAYVLHYGEEGALVVNKLSVMVDSKESLDPAKMFTININTNSLSTNVKYIVQVAAKTEDGEGPFSSAKSFILEGTWIHLHAHTYMYSHRETSLM